MHGQSIDPFQAPSPGGAVLTGWIARGTLAWGLVYLVYRVVFTLEGSSPTAAAVLLAAETLAVAVFALRLRSASADPVDVVDVPDAPVPSTTIVIDAADASIDDLRNSLVSCRRVRGVERIVIADPADPSGLAPIGERFNATIVDKPATSVAAETSAIWVLLVRAGDLPMPDALEIVATVCSSPDVGVVQLGAEEADPSSFEHDPSGRWSLGPFEHQVVRPGLAAAGSIPWYGDTPAMVRPAAIRDATVTDTSTVELGLHAQRIGYRVTTVPRTLARLRGPQSLRESLRNRFDRTAALRRAALRPLPGISRSARVAHRLALIDPLAAVQRVLLVAAAVLALGFGQLPLDAPFLEIVVMAGPAYLLRWNTQILLGRGRLGPFSVLRSDLRSVGVDLLFGFGRPIGRRLTLLLAMTVALSVACIVAALAVWRDVADRLPDGAMAVGLLVTVGFLGVALEVLLDAVMRRQRRVNHRVRLGLVTCTIDGHDGQLHDLSSGGCGLVLTATPDAVSAIGSPTDVVFRIPDAAGAWRDVRATVTIAHIAPEGDGTTRVGLAFDDPTDAPLDPVVEFLTVDRRLVALGRRTHETV